MSKYVSDGISMHGYPFSMLSNEIWGVFIYFPVPVGSTGTGVGWSMVRRGPPERVVAAVGYLGAGGSFFYIFNPFFETQGNINACIMMETSNIHACISILDKSLGIEPSSCPQFWSY